MSDNLRRFRSIHRRLKKLYPFEPKGNLARHLRTLAAMMSGIVGSKSSNLPKIAAKVVDSSKPESRVKTFSRWIANDRIDYETYCLPYVELLISSLMNKPLALIVDVSAVGRNCVTLVASVLYKSRALPIAWITQTGQKGHWCEELHIELLKQVHGIIPDEATVIFLGDGEFDGMDLIKTIQSYQWQYVCRTAKNRIFRNKQQEKFSLRYIGVGQEEYFLLPEVLPSEEAYGPLHVMVWWEKKYQEPIYLLSNIELAREAMYWYKKRFHIETLFSDQKSRGFNIHKSHLSDPTRLNRLMMVICLAYIWVVFLGVLAIETGLHKIIHRTDRCDLSLFQLGLRMLEYRLNLYKSIPVAFQMNLFEKFAKSVR